LARVLTRMAAEGWVLRRAGYGWTFLPVLKSLESHRLAYRFRMTIEPAALLEPTFRIDHGAFARCRAQQQVLLEGRINKVSAVELFAAGSALHEMLVQCANNVFFLDALRRVDRLRRLLEYRAMVEPGRFVAQAREHLELLDLIEAGDRMAAASLMRRHLDQVSAVKLRTLRGDRSRSRAAEQRQPRLDDDAVAHLHF